MNWLQGKTIVAPTDFSEVSVNTLDWIRTVVAKPSDLIVIHVVAVDVLGDTSVPRREIAEGKMENLMNDPSYRGVYHRVLLGDPGSKIAEFADEVNADLVLLPSHGRSGLSRLLIGSVAERVIRTSPCPVLVLREGS